MSQAPERIVHSISTGTIVKSILIVLSFLLLFYIRDIILILLTAVVIASAIEPGTRWFVRRGLPRLLAVALIYVAIIIGILALSYLIIPSFLHNLSGFMDTLPKYITTLNVNSGSGFVGWRTAIQDLSSSGSLADAAKNITATLTTATSGVLATLTAVFGGLTSLVIILVLSFYLCVQERGIEQFLKIITPLRHEDYIIGLWRRTQHKIGRWMQGQLLLALIVGVLVFIGLSILGVKNAFFLALISAVFEIIPIFGPVIGAVPGVLIAFIQGGPTFGIIVVLLYIIVQQIESNVIYPLVVQKVLDIHPLVVIIALLVGARLGGILGLLLSVPIATAFTEFLTDISKNRNAAREKFRAQVEP